VLSSTVHTSDSAAAAVIIVVIVKELLELVFKHRIVFVVKAKVKVGRGGGELPQSAATGRADQDAGCASDATRSKVVFAEDA